MNADLRNTRLLILSAAPTDQVELRTIFSDDPEGIRRKLENPPDLRPNGWGLATLDRAKFLAGNSIRVETFRTLIDLYRDGYFLLVGDIGQEFLAWSDPEGRRIHPLALVELTDNFTRFYDLVIRDFKGRSDTIEFRIELRNMRLDGISTRLPAGPVGTLGWQFGGGMLEAPANDWSWQLTVEKEEYAPDRVAFQLVRELYVWFGHSEEKIPYAKDDDGMKVVDAAQIASIR